MPQNSFWLLQPKLSGQIAVSFSISCPWSPAESLATVRRRTGRSANRRNDPANAPSRHEAHVSDDEIRDAIVSGQLKLQRERRSDLTLFSPIAGLTSHHLGNERTSIEWAELSNDLVHRVPELFPDNFAPVCQLP
ncbi:hypothetical protein [Burkholderia sp. WSM2230]|uniref:hypothetical protein n=1 Tax=Burkholderia sp. WSM2230 TaxID=944435 RepID=UPI001E4DD461|nr:hypothetical protein [Burkholderia sp. WSM2230]